MASKIYALETARPKSTRKAVRPHKLRASLVPGTVLIILAGRFSGKRVVYLKNLEDSTLLVTGPFKVNGVPLRRVNSRFVIATKTKIDVSSLDLSRFDVPYFAREKKSKKSHKSEKDFFNEAGEKKEIKAERVNDQKIVDKSLIAEIKKTPMLKQYLASSFSLKHGDKPHAMVF